MNCSGIYDSALRAISESDANGNTDDYEERAGYLLATFCHQCGKIDRDYRSAFALPKQEKLPGVKVDPETLFPLSDAFVPAAIYYLAAMLVIDENETVSDKFYSFYTDAIASLQCSIPSISNKIKNVYPM